MKDLLTGCQNHNHDNAPRFQVRGWFVPACSGDRYPLHLHKGRRTGKRAAGQSAKERGAFRAETVARTRPAASSSTGPVLFSTRLTIEMEIPAFAITSEMVAPEDTPYIPVKTFTESAFSVKRRIACLSIVKWKI